MLLKLWKEVVVLISQMKGSLLDAKYLSCFEESDMLPVVGSDSLRLDPRTHL